MWAARLGMTPNGAMPTSAEAAIEKEVTPMGLARGNLGVILKIRGPPDGLRPFGGFSFKPSNGPPL